MWPFTSSKPPPPSPTPPEGGPKIGKSGKKICCSCPDTKAARDACIRQNGEEDVSCQKLIELHKECLRGEGFSVKQKKRANHFANECCGWVWLEGGECCIFDCRGGRDILVLNLFTVRRGIYSSTFVYVQNQSSLKNGLYCTTFDNGVERYCRAPVVYTESEVRSEEIKWNLERACTQPYHSTLSS